MNKLLISISLLWLSTTGYTQVSQKSILNSSNVTLNQIKSSMQVYFDSLHQVFGDSVFLGEGTEYSEYKRFINFFEPRLSANVSFDDFFRSQIVTVNNQVLSSSWKEIGPNNTLTNGIGTTEFISFYDDGTPASTQHMLTGSLAGGLFYSDNAGENWHPAGSDKR